MSEFESIEYEVERGRARITLNRPEKLNALSLKLQSELNEALWEADNNKEVHCVTALALNRLVFEKELLPSRRVAPARQDGLRLDHASELFPSLRGREESREETACVQSGPRRGVLDHLVLQRARDLSPVEALE